MLNDTEKYWARMAIHARDGDSHAMEILHGMPMECPPEIYEFYRLSMDLNIRVNTPEQDRLETLTDKYDTDEVLAYQVW